ncbi:MAG: TetR/AcrR family transcriptional regulator [Ferruginibacter sp.]|nr:TetR/AcrR family transcriptional regulator [Ferruginibacter sp.]
MATKTNDTKEAILLLGAELIQQVGYHAFSYADIAKKLGIKNAAVHYHFPGKADLYESIVDSHISNYTKIGEEIAQAPVPAKAKLERIFSRYRNLVDSDRICVIGAIAADYKTLPGKTRSKVVTLVELVLKLVEKTLQEGKKNGEFFYTASARVQSLLIMTNLSAGVQLARITGKKDFETIRLSILKQLTG